MKSSHETSDILGFVLLLHAAIQKNPCLHQLKLDTVITQFWHTLAMYQIAQFVFSLHLLIFLFFFLTRTLVNLVNVNSPLKKC